jgi:hypothetical protein
MCDELCPSGPVNASALGSTNERAMLTKMVEGMKVSLFAVGIPVCVILFVSMTGFAREKTVWRFVQLLGAIFLFMVVVAHIAEAFHLFP